jgi:uncharacterized lipoprotein YbaY
MRHFGFSSIAAALVLAGCAKETTAPVQPASVTLRATITPDNRCTVETLGQTYTSIGQVRGVVLPAFSGNLENDGYHAVGCWVAAPDGTDGDLVVLFAGNSFQKQFETGTFQPRFEPPFGATDKIVSVSFRAAVLTNQRLATVDQSTGSVVVDSDAKGNRTVRVDVTAIKYDL